MRLQRPVTGAGLWKRHPSARRHRSSRVAWTVPVPEPSRAFGHIRTGPVVGRARSVNWREVPSQLQVSVQPPFREMGDTPFTSERHDSGRGDRWAGRVEADLRLGRSAPLPPSDAVARANPVRPDPDLRTEGSHPPTSLTNRTARAPHWTPVPDRRQGPRDREALAVPVTNPRPEHRPRRAPRARPCAR